MSVVVYSPSKAQEMPRMVGAGENGKKYLAPIRSNTWTTPFPSLPNYSLRRDTADTAKQFLRITDSRVVARHRCSLQTRGKRGVVQMLQVERLRRARRIVHHTYIYIDTCYDTVHIPRPLYLPPKQLADNSLEWHAPYLGACCMNDSTCLLHEAWELNAAR